jgi:hypothetical protein
MVVSELLDLNLGCDFESVAHLWLANKRHELTNVISSAVLWSLWKLRNEIYFQGTKWTGMAKLLLKIVRMLRRWIPMFKQELGSQVETFASRLETLASLPPRIKWRTVEENLSSELAQSAARQSDTSARSAQLEASSSSYYLGEVSLEHGCGSSVSSSISAIRPEFVC